MTNVAVCWQEYCYRLRLGKWGIAIRLNCGYTQRGVRESAVPAMEVIPGLYFRDICPSYPQSQPMTEEERGCFCAGLGQAGERILAASPYPEDTLILLRNISFSICDVQEEEFTAAALGWAALTFGFSLGDEIQVSFAAEEGVNGRYHYEFR